MPSIASEGIHVTAVTDFSILIATLLSKFRQSLPLSRISLGPRGYPLRETETSESDVRRESREKAPVNAGCGTGVGADRPGHACRYGRDGSGRRTGEHRTSAGRR